MPRRPDVPCASCGALMWKGRGSLPAGSATCRPCRRAAYQHGTAKGYRVMGCRCQACRAWATGQIKVFRRRMRDLGLTREVPARNRAAVYARDGLICQLCLEPTDPAASPHSDWFPSVDHIVPVSRGGTHDVSNLRTAHRWCNCVRSDERAYTDEDFRAAA